MALAVSARPIWIIEGVYGWLAEVALSPEQRHSSAGFSVEPLPRRAVARGPRVEQRRRTPRIIDGRRPDWESGDAKFIRGSSFAMFDQCIGGKFRPEDRDQVSD